MAIELATVVGIVFDCEPIIIWFDTDVLVMPFKLFSALSKLKPLFPSLL